MKNIRVVIGIIIGVLITGTISAFAIGILASDIKYNDSMSVKDALDQLYAKGKDGIISEISLTIMNRYQLPVFSDGNITYQSSDNSIAEVNSSAIVVPIKSGDVTISIMKDSTPFLKYVFKIKLNLFDITSGYVWNNGAYYTLNNTTNKNKIKNVLTNSGKASTDISDIILLKNTSTNLGFSISQTSNISFSSGYYTDGGGTSGKVVNVYKVDTDGKETLYYKFTQLNNTNNYGKKLFQPGNYVMRAESNYVIFNEFTIEPLNECLGDAYEGSPYTFAGYNWHVINADGNQATLLMDSKQTGTYGTAFTAGMGHNSKDSDTYTWGNSLINNYLNTTFYNSLSAKEKNSIIASEICNDSTGNGGSLKSQNLTCNSGYVTSKIRLITRDEYTALKALSDSSSWLYCSTCGLTTGSYSGRWWTMASAKSTSSYACSVNDGSLSDVNHSSNQYGIRPVVTISC